MKNLIVGQSGGPTAVINSSLYGVIQEGLAQKENIGHVYGMINGIEGFLKGNYTDLAESGSPDPEPYARLPALISVPADTNFRRIFPIRSMRNFFRNLKSCPSDISYTSVEMIPWIPSVSSPVLPRLTKAAFVSSVFPRPLTMCDPD